MPKAVLNKRDARAMIWDNAAQPNGVDDVLDSVSNNFDDLLDDHAEAVVTAYDGAPFEEIGTMTETATADNPFTLDLTGKKEIVLIGSTSETTGSNSVGISWKKGNATQNITYTSLSASTGRRFYIRCRDVVGWIEPSAFKYATASSGYFTDNGTARQYMGTVAELTSIWITSINTDQTASIKIYAR